MYCCSTCPSSWSVCTNHAEHLVPFTGQHYIRDAISGTTDATMYCVSAISTTTTESPRQPHPCLICPCGHDSTLCVVPHNTTYQCDICNVHLLPSMQMYCCNACPRSWSICTTHAESDGGLRTRTQHSYIHDVDDPSRITGAAMNHFSTFGSTTASRPPCLICPSGHSSPLSVVPMTHTMTFQCDLCCAKLLPGSEMYCCTTCPGSWSVCTTHAGGLTQLLTADVVAAVPQPTTLRPHVDEYLYTTVDPSSELASSSSFAYSCRKCPSGHDCPLTVVPATEMYQCDICSWYLVSGTKLHCCMECPGAWAACVHHP
jgi:hypothetical protein